MSVNSNPRRELWGWASPVHRDLFPDWYAVHRDDGEGRRIRWADHQDVRRVAGRVSYVCHPYQLHGEALADFERLRALGWRVDVYGESDYHEHALMVVIEKRPKSPRMRFKASSVPVDASEHVSGVDAPEHSVSFASLDTSEGATA